MTVRLTVFVLTFLALSGAFAASADISHYGWLPAGTFIPELSTASARHYSNGNGSIRAVLEAKGEPTDTISSQNASYSGYSELAYLYGSLYQAVKHNGSYFFAGYYGDVYPDYYLLERAYAQWDIASIRDSSAVNSIVCSTYCSGINGSVDSFKLFHMRLQPSLVTSAQNLYNDAGDGNSYAKYTPPSGYSGVALNSAARTELQRLLQKPDTNWFAVGYSGYPTIAGYNTWEWQFNGWNQGNPPRLIIDYTPPSLAHDVGVSHVVRPSGTIDSITTITPACSVYNYGTNTESYSVRMKLGTSYNYSAVVSGHAASTRIYVTFQAQNGLWPRGGNAVTCSTELTGDLRTSNDKRTGSFNIQVRDVGCTRIIAPAGNTDSGTSVVPACSIYNYGTTTESYNVRMKIGAGYNQPATATSHAPGTYLYLTFPVWIASPRGALAVSCSTEAIGDMVPANDKRTGSVTVTQSLTHDVGCRVILAPVGSVDSGASVTPACSVINYGNSTESYPVRMKIGSSYSATATVSGHASGATIYVTFPNWTAGPVGTLAVSCSTELAGEMQAANDKLTGSVTVRRLVHDVGCTRLIAPAATCDSGASVTPACSVYNYGTYTETYNVRMKVGSGYNATVTVAGHPEATARYVTFPAWTARERGSNAVSCSTELAGDAVNANDKSAGTVTVNVHDVGTVEILDPVDTLETGLMTPSVVARNYGTVRDPNVTLRFTINCIPPYDEAVTLPSGLPVGTDTTIDFPDWDAVVGDYVARCSTCMSNDQPHENDTLAAAFTVVLPGVIDVAVAAIMAPTGTVDTGALVAPQARLANLGEDPATFRTWFTIKDSTGAAVYTDSFTVASLAPGASTTHYYAVWPPAHPAGAYTTRCLAFIAGDEDRSNDTMSGSFAVVAGGPHAPGWFRLLDMPEGGKAKRVKDGGCLTYYPADPAYVYALKGNGRCEYYRYGVGDNVWVTKESIPAFGSSGKKKAVKKGGSLTEAAGKVYATKGNGTLEFWQYDPALSGTPSYPWKQKTDVPVGAKMLKEGVGMASVTVADTAYVYLLKGSSTSEFYRYNTISGTWQTMAQAPTGTSGKSYKNGSTIALDPDGQTIYALKGSYAELFAYDLAANTWSTRTSLPLTGSSGRKKKNKDGAGMAVLDRQLFALKGNNTTEFWMYQTDSNRWFQQEDMPLGGGRRVKAGGGLTVDDWCLYALKGNNTLELWQYVPPVPVTGTMLRPQAQGSRTPAFAGRGLTAFPNPCTDRTTVRYSLAHAGRFSLKLYDVGGRIVTTLAIGSAGVGAYSLRLDPGPLPRGVYLLRLEGPDANATLRLVLE